MPTSLRPRLWILLIVCTISQLLSPLGTRSAHAQSTVSGEAFGVSASSILVTLTEFPDVVLAPEGGTASAAVAGLNLVGLLTTGAIAVDTNGTTGPSNADSESTATVTVNANGTTSPTMASSDASARVEGLVLLAGLVTADVAQAVSSSTCDGATANSTDVNTVFVNLVVNGMPIAGTPPPNTVIAVPGVATITLNEQIPGGNGTTTSSRTINMIHVVLAGGLGEAIVTSAASGVDCAPVIPPVGPTCTPVPVLTPTANMPTATPTVAATATAPTPTQTGAPATATPTPTASASPSPDLNHFICYEIHSPPLNLAGVSLVHDFGPSTATVKRAKRICLPADKNDEDPVAVGQPETITGFTIKQTTPRFPRRKGVSLTNQFGTVTFDVFKPDRLFVPTAKSLAGIPAPPMFPALDHFKCYKVAYAKTRVAGVKLDDQFGTVTVDVKKPLHLCVAVDKNGEGIPSPGQALMCYLVRTTTGTPRPHKHLPNTLYTTHQFGSDALEVFGPRELCVPSTLLP